MSSKQDKFNGNLNVAAGKMKHAVGALTGDKELIEEAEAQTVKGETQKATSELKNAIHKGIHAAGEAVEQEGKRILNAGLKSLGEIIQKTGEKVKKSTD